MNVLVTGADGFVGSWLVPRLVEAGHSVTAAIFSEDSPERADSARGRFAAVADVVELDVRRDASVQSVADRELNAVIHLAAVSSGAQALKDPMAAWEVNTVGTVRLAEHVAQQSGGGQPRFLFVSTGEVYGAPDGEMSFDERSATTPNSPYAASKLAAEVGVLEVSRRTGLSAMIARPFGHTGAGQDTRFVVPSFARRIIDAKALNAVAVPVGNLECVRDFTSVHDVVEAYHLLLEHGEPGEVYNIASGQGTSLRDVFFLIADAVGARIIPEVDSAFIRSADIPYLVGDATKLRNLTGWNPSVSLEATIKEVVDACS